MAKGYCTNRGIIRNYCIIALAMIFTIYISTYMVQRVSKDNALFIQFSQNVQDLNLTRKKDLPRVVIVDDVSKRLPNNQACIHPRLDPGPNAFPYRKVPPVTCSDEQDWVYAGDGKFYISSAAVAKHGVITCDTVAIEKSKADDMQLGYHAKNQLNNTDLHSDHFQVNCSAADGKQYENVHSGIKVDRNDLTDGSKDDGNGTMGVNVLMLGFDSLSRPMLQIQMPKTHDLFVNKLGGQILEGYNIVGDGTTQALIPMLTGSEEPLLPETRRGKPNAQTVDCYPFIWKEFEKKGYITHFFEDSPKMSAFTRRLSGFRDQPVHHYMRPFYIAAQKRARKQCLGSIPMHELGYNSLKQSFRIHAQTGKSIFALSFMNAGHDDNNMVQPLDPSTADFLQHLYSHGYLNKTVVMLFGDHGSRYGALRSTERGKLEERMPYVAFLLPKWLDIKFPSVINNFQVNIKRLSSPFDIHATFKHIIYPRKPKLAHVNNVEISLFDEIPPERTCAHAHIEPHWCACLNWKNISTTDENILKAASAVVEYINRMLHNYSQQCDMLTLVSVQSAKTYSVHDSFMKFHQSADDDRRIPSFGANTKSSILIYQIMFVTKPGEGMFEATVEKNIAENTFKPNEKDISRLNKYGRAADCIASHAPYLQPYCYCK